MGAKLTTTGLIGLGCIAAAAAGGYLALRSNAADRPTAPVVATAGQGAPQPGTAPSTPETPAPAAAPASKPSAPESLSRRSSEPQATQTARPTITEPVPATPPAVPVAEPVAPPPAPAPTPVAPASTAPAATPAAPAPAPAKFDEVTVAANSVMGIRLDSTISSETARVEDRVNARLTRDLVVDGRVVFPAQSRLEGVVKEVERGGKFKDRPRLAITFHTLVMGDGTRVALQTDTVFREGESPSGHSNAKVGGSAVVGAIIGAMIGGKKGAILGGSAGAAGGAAAVAAGDHADLVMTAGTTLTLRIIMPVTVLIERDHEG